jgi:segregation and condensation protein B
VGRDYDPVPGQWYENLEEEEIFHVVKVDEDSELISLQYEDGDTEEIDLETWTELDLELTQKPEGWSSEDADDDDLDEDEEDDDWEDDDEDDDDDDLDEDEERDGY